MIRNLIKIPTKSMITLQRYQQFSKSAGLLNSNLLSTNNLINKNNEQISAEQLNVDKISAENNNDAEDLNRKLQILKLEVSVLRQEGRKAPNPDLLNQTNWDRLLALPSKSARYKYYTFLWSLEKKKENFQAKREIHKEKVKLLKEQQVAENAENKHIIYSLMNTNIFLRIYESTMNLWHNNKLTRAMQFGQKLIFDCSYDKHMNERESINAAKQLMLSFADNRINDDPYDLHFCNANLNGTTMKYLHKHIPTMMEKEFPLNVHECSYLDLFPKEQLIYLTPHCRTDLVDFDPDAIFIIGAMVDKINNEPLSLAKAKSLGLRMARLPLDRYLQFGAGSGKSLTLNQMTQILLDLKRTRNWDKALLHVPRRKIFNNNSSSILSSSFSSRQQIPKRWEKNVEKFKFNFNSNLDLEVKSTSNDGDNVMRKNVFSKSNYRGGDDRFSKKKTTNR